MAHEDNATGGAVNEGIFFLPEGIDCLIPHTSQARYAHERFVDLLQHAMLSPISDYEIVGNTLQCFTFTQEDLDKYNAKDSE